jgi:hypothetical protein
MYAINQLPKRNAQKAPTGCCPEFKPQEWDGRIFRFDNKLFMKVVTRSFLHIPLNMTSVMKRSMRLIETAGAGDDEYLMLSYDVSPWKCEHYISAAKETPGAEMVRLSGTYLAKVFEGPFKDAGKWYKQLIEYVKSRGAKLVKVYFSYTTCPSCAKVYGKNYVVGFAQIERPPA